MGKQKYNHEIGKVYIVRNQYEYVGVTYPPSYYIRWVVEKTSSKRATDERYGMFNIHIEGGRFTVSTSRCGRTTLNNFAKKSITIKELEKRARLEFLLLGGDTVEGMIEQAIARYKKHYKTRYSVKFDPDQIKIKE